MQPLPVHWHKNPQNNEWFDLLKLNLDDAYFKQGRKGVFVIWYAAPEAGVAIRVGSGDIGEQLKNIRQNPLITSYSKYGTLKVSWIAANGVMTLDNMLGVEAFLNNRYSPIIPTAIPPAAPVPVKLIGQQ